MFTNHGRAAALTTGRATAFFSTTGTATGAVAAARLSLSGGAQRQPLNLRFRQRVGTFVPYVLTTLAGTCVPLFHSVGVVF